MKSESFDDSTDTFGRHLRDLRISVTDRCNFRCPYCMPSEVYGERYEFLPKTEILSFEEIVRFARLFTRLGVRKIRLTGGEPLLRVDLPQLIESLAALDGIEDIALTTNGYLLADQAQSLNLYIDNASGKKLDITYRMAWFSGLKTTYYLRSLAATGAEKSTVDSGTLNAVSSSEPTEAAPVPQACSLEDPECEACQ